MASKEYEILAFGISDVGRVMTVNEDSFVFRVEQAGSDPVAVLAVADGIGGLDCGEVASSIAISNINRWWDQTFKIHYNEPEYLVYSLVESFRRTNNDLLGRYSMEGKKMGTTLSVLVIYKGKYLIVHVGDSRIYRVRNAFFGSRVQQLTKDHSTTVKRQLGNRSVSKSVLTNALGNKPQFDYYTEMESVERQDLFLLCSDGIYKTRSPEQLGKVVRQCKNDLQRLCHTLIEQAKQNGETDNMTVIALKIV
jgi:serine/threonine protein phosphatase PrpC